MNQAAAPGLSEGWKGESAELTEVSDEVESIVSSISVVYRL
jgi:hypothetical protein